MLYVVFFGIKKSLHGDVTNEGIKIGNTNYIMYDVPNDIRIDMFVDSKGYEYKKGCGYYEFIKKEIIRPNRTYLLVDNKNRPKRIISNTVKVIGPTHKEVYNYPYGTFMQSTSSTRKLQAGTKFILNTNGLVKTNRKEVIMHPEFR